MAAQPMESWLDVEKPISTPVEAEFFSLTSLFIELIDAQPKAVHHIKNYRAR
jgi:hypothetical protein